VLFRSSSAAASDNDVGELRDPASINWTGLYAGVSAGGANVEDDDDAFPIAPGFTIPLHSEGDGLTQGFHLGYMHQFGSFVIGAEYEYTDIDIQYSGEGIGPIPVFVEDSHSIRLRGGIAFNRLHVYAHGGMTFVNTNVELSDWVNTAGVGAELALTNNIIIGVQYDHSWFEEFDDRPISGTMDRRSARISFKF